VATGHSPIILPRTPANVKAGLAKSDFVKNQQWWYNNTALLESYKEEKE
jgi:hypothetical protein